MEPTWKITRTRVSLFATLAEIVEKHDRRIPASAVLDSTPVTGAIKKEFNELLRDHGLWDSSNVSGSTVGEMLDEMGVV